MLKLMYITNDPAVAKIADAAGVDRIFVDLEQVGKQKRQANWDSVKSLHSVEDIAKIKSAVKNAEIFVRTDPVFDGLEDEIEKVIANGADVVMLPYFKTPDEVRRFVSLVNGRARVSILIETKEAVECIDEILSMKGIDEVHIGLNDLSHSYGMSFLFEPLANGMVDKITEKLKEYSVASYGFGGIASIGKGLLPAERIIPEHYRLGSACAILSRAFCNTAQITDLDEIDRIFKTGVADIRLCEKRCAEMTEEQYAQNRSAMIQSVEQIAKDLSSNK